jgi:hypothetical protein
MDKKFQLELFLDTVPDISPEDLHNMLYMWLEELLLSYNYYHFLGNLYFKNPIILNDI